MPEILRKIHYDSFHDKNESERLLYKKCIELNEVIFILILILREVIFLVKYLV